MTKSKNTPKLRFPEFKEDWENGIIGDISDNIVAGATPSTSVQEFWKNGSIPWLSSGELNKRIIHETINFITKKGFDSSSTKMVPKNSILIGLAGQGKTRGTVAINKIELCTNQSIASIIVNNKVHYKFIFYVLFKKYEELRALSSSGSGRGGLNLKLINSFKIKFSSFEEQEKISNFLSKVDEKISLLEDKLSYFGDFKKFCMEALFAQKLRFKKEKGENYHDWEEKKLKHLVIIPKKEKLSSVQNKILLKVKLHCKGVETNENIKPKITKRGRPYYERNADEILIGRQNFHNGGFGIVSKELNGGIASNAITSLVTKNTIKNNFLLYYFSRSDFYKRAEILIGGTGQKEISQNELLKIKIKVPQLEEQEKIANFLVNIDNKIENINYQLDQTNEFKKGLLQQMFI